jgi:chromosome segregation ATPase
VLYLAEVQKKAGNMFGGGKAELKLLAMQRSEQSWSAVPSEETVAADEANDYGAGALVLVEMTGNKQVRSVQPAARQLVSILQNFSRLQERFKTQEEEIEQWKQSLTYQSQELNRREMEMEAQREQMAQMDDDFARLESQRQEMAGLQAQVEQQRQEFESKQQELQGAWDHLRGEQQRLEDRQESMPQGSSLDAAQAQTLHDLLARLSEAVPGSQGWQDNLSFCVNSVEYQHATLGQHWQILESQRSNSQQLHEAADSQAAEVDRLWQAWHEAQEEAQSGLVALKVQEEGLKLRQAQAQTLQNQLSQIETLHQQVAAMASGGSPTTGQKVDVAALEAMDLGELQRLAQDLEKDLNKLSQFVQSQEEELNAKQQEISEIEQKIQAANEFDRLNLENELSDERDGYQMLNETLVGQRRTLAERQAVVTLHRSIMRRRQGYSDSEGSGSGVDLSPIVQQLDHQKQQTESVLHSLQAEIAQLQADLQPAYEQMEARNGAVQSVRGEIDQAQQALQERRGVAVDSVVRIHLYQDLLQPLQDQIDGMRQQLGFLQQFSGDLQGSGEMQSQAIAEMRQILATLSGSPAMAMS